MKRREFVTLLGGAAVAWPLAARAQQDTLRLVGVLAGFSEDEMRPLLAAFRSRMSQLGWIEGRNLAIDLRLGAGDHRRTTTEAGALVGRKPDVILAMGTPGLTAVRQHSDSVPVVFTLVADPVSTGMIESLARPGRNATGFTNFEFSIGGKWLELLKEVSPGLSASLSDPAGPHHRRYGSWWRARHSCAAHRTVALGAARPAIRHRKPPRWRLQYRHRGGRARRTGRLHTSLG
jgi:putative tryptophan/tyrosine transport system substrate-binding protein